MEKKSAKSMEKFSFKMSVIYEGKQLFLLSQSLKKLFFFDCITFKKFKLKKWSKA